MKNGKNEILGFAVETCGVLAYLVLFLLLAVLLH